MGLDGDGRCDTCPNHTKVPHVELFYGLGFSNAAETTPASSILGAWVALNGCDKPDKRDRLPTRGLACTEQTNTLEERRFSEQTKRNGTASPTRRNKTPRPSQRPTES